MRAPLHRLLSLAGLLLLAAVAALAWVAQAGMTIDAGNWRGEVAARLSQALGRPVVLTGPISLTLSLSPSLRAGGLQVPGPQGDLLSVGQVRLSLELTPWLRSRELRVSELAGEDVRLSLRRGADGRGNWEAPPAASEARVAPASGGVPGAIELPGAVVIGRLSLARLALDYTGADGVRHLFDLDSLEAVAPVRRHRQAVKLAGIEHQLGVETQAPECLVHLLDADQRHVEVLHAAQEERRRADLVGAEERVGDARPQVLVLPRQAELLLPLHDVLVDAVERHLQGARRP